MIDLSAGQRRIVGIVGAFFLFTGLIGIVLTTGGRYATSPTVLALVGRAELETPVYLYSMTALVVAFTFGYVVRRNKSDDERHGLD